MPNSPILKKQVYLFNIWGQQKLSSSWSISFRNHDPKNSISPRFVEGIHTGRSKNLSAEIDPFNVCHPKTGTFCRRSIRKRTCVTCTKWRAIQGGTPIMPTFRYRSTLLSLSLSILMLFLLAGFNSAYACLLYTSPSPRDRTRSRMPSSA